MSSIHLKNPDIICTILCVHFFREIMFIKKNIILQLRTHYKYKVENHICPYCRINNQSGSSSINDCFPKVRTSVDVLWSVTVDGFPKFSIDWSCRRGERIICSIYFHALKKKINTYFKHYQTFWNIWFYRRKIQWRTHDSQLWVLKGHGHYLRSTILF